MQSTNGRAALGLVVSVALALAASGAWPSLAGTQNISINSGSGPLERCDQLDISFDDRPAARGEERIHVPISSEALRITLTHHGGVALSEGSGAQHEITLCKAVPPDGGNALAEVRAVVGRATVELAGPSGVWVAYLIVRSPRGSRLELSATNGPIRVDEFEGRVGIRTKNGPIALASVRGEVSARAENGPIKLHGGSGQIELQTSNGPIGVRLAGKQWHRGALAARAHNGPLSVTVPAGYRSGVEIESSDHAPWSCRGTPGCAGRSTTGGASRARFGDGPTHVRLSTVNGPVKVNVAGR